MPLHCSLLQLPLFPLFSPPPPLQGGAASPEHIKAGLATLVIVGAIVVLVGLGFYLKNVFNGSKKPPSYEPVKVDSYQCPKAPEPDAHIPFWARKARRRSSQMGLAMEAAFAVKVRLLERACSQRQCACSTHCFIIGPDCAHACCSQVGMRALSSR
jgi:hypothetical protein